eukprot:1156797-Pelagomonas_calceolata.AAC.6
MELKGHNRHVMVAYPFSVCALRAQEKHCCSFARNASASHANAEHINKTVKVSTSIRGPQVLKDTDTLLQHTPILSIISACMHARIFDFSSNFPFLPPPCLLKEQGKESKSSFLGARAASNVLGAALLGQQQHSRGSSSALGARTTF